VTTGSGDLTAGDRVTAGDGSIAESVAKPELDAGL
jgi:hypothetical protein